MNPQHRAGGKNQGRHPHHQSIAVTTAESHQEHHRHHGGQQVGRHHGKPDARQTKNQGQHQNCRHLEHQGPQEGDEGGDQAIVQGGKKAGTPNIDARKDKAKKADAAPPQSHLHELGVIAGKQGHQRHGKNLAERNQNHAASNHQHKSLSEHIVQFGLVSGPIVIADDGT